MEWLVHMEFEVPDGTPEGSVRQRVDDERARAAQLVDAGTVLRLWRVPGRWANWGVWSAADATELHAALTSLPLFGWARVSVHPLAEHPGDPASGG